MSSSRYSGRPSPVFVTIILLVCILAGVAVGLMISAMIIPPQPGIKPPPVETTVAPTETTAPPADTTVPPADTTVAPAETTASSTAETTAAPAETTAPAPVTTAPPETEPPKPTFTILPRERTAVGEDYFNSVVFIGDSRTQGLQISTGGYGATVYADRGLSVDGITNKKFVVKKAPDGTSRALSIIESLTEEPHKGMIYIWLGINELGTPNPASYEKAFRRQLEAVQTACPEATIVVMSLLPVGRNASVYGMPSNVEVNNRVKTYNDILLKLAEEAGAFYLNAYESFADAEGFLPDGYATDGIHLVRDQNIAVCDYIRNHPVPEQFRSKP